MNVRKIRPNFDVRLAEPGVAALQRVQQSLSEDPSEVDGWVQPPYAELAVGQAHRQWWSPRLALHLQTRDDDTEVLHCRFQPEPGVWTMYMAGWAMLTVSTMLVIGFGCAQSILGQPPTVCLYGLPIATLSGLSLYGVALLGQRLSEPEVQRLTEALHRALDRDAPRDRQQGRSSAAGRVS